MFLKMAASRLLAPAPLSSRMSACDKLTLASSGVDLTFATRLAADSEVNVKSKTPQKRIFAVVVLDFHIRKGAR